jgi:2-hydroxycyclohexanecarboxyl-CoA dehydrogenase
MTTRTAIVTGGASGIGEAISRRLAEEGNQVAIFDLDSEAAQKIAASIEEQGAKTMALQVDVTDRAGIEGAVEAVRRDLGRPTILVNSAGLALDGPFLETSQESWKASIAVNLTGTFDCCQVVIPDMISEGWGRIVNISSSSFHSGAPGLAGYVAAKSGVVGLTKVLAKEFGKFGITVNTVPPGFINTPMFRRTVDSGFVDLDAQIAATPVGRIGEPEDIAVTCSFLVSEEAGYITGQVFGVNGGRNM